MGTKNADDYNNRDRKRSKSGFSLTRVTLVRSKQEKKQNRVKSTNALQETKPNQKSGTSQVLSRLETAGYLEIKKSGYGRGSVTSFKITKNGLTAYRKHRAALESLLTGRSFAD